MTGAAISAVRIETAPPPVPGARLLAPLGVASSLGSVAGLAVERGRILETQIGRASCRERVFPVV